MIMKNKLKLNILFVLVPFLTFAQVQRTSNLQVGDTSSNSLNSSSALQLDSTTKGFLPPRMTLDQRNAINTPVKGLTIFNTTINCLEWYNGTSWYNSCENSTSGGTAIISSYSCNTASNGTMTLLMPVSGVTQTITAIVTKTGTYNISTLNSNGVVFSASGNFTALGDQIVTLTATGTPTNSGSTIFTLSTTPNCSFSRNVDVLISPSVAIPNSIILSQSQKHLIASAYDKDYLPYKVPTTSASINLGVADNVDEQNRVNFLGTINATTGITIKIPVTATTSGTLQPYGITISIPSSMTEDGIGGNVKFSWPQQIYNSSTKTILANIVAVGSTLNVKKLDINSGMGSDYLGLVLGTFTYPYNSLGTTTTFEIRAVSLIPDKMAGVVDNTQNASSHMMFYVPVIAEDGRIWLNNALGAQYSNMNNASFNPNKQATSATDFNSYSSLFQLGRKPDGHELITWTNTSGTPVNGINSILNDIPNDASFIKSTNDWRNNQDSTLWSSESSTNNPCPKGYRVPSNSEITTYISSAGTTDVFSNFNARLKFPFSGARDNSSGNVYSFGSQSDIWTNGSTWNNSFYFYNSSSSNQNSAPAYGFTVMCIKN
jgi:hypothetical protein